MFNGPTIQDFFQQFPNDDACLDYLMQLRHGEKIDCPKCGKHGKFARIKREKAYSCPWCGHHIHPMVGTPFHKSHTPLQKWFYAMYLFTTTRHGVPAKELQRQLGVSYPTALRMSHEIRKYMTTVDGDPPLSGHVEADETYVGGKPRYKGREDAHEYRSRKIAVFGMVERDGDVITRIVPNARRDTLIPHVVENVEAGSTISTDEWHPYKALPREGYKHLIVKHKHGEYVNGEAHTNTLDGFWSIIKRSIRGTHVHVSRQHLAKYLGEFEFRYNRRKHPETMFAELLASL